MENLPHQDRSLLMRLLSHNQSSEHELPLKIAITGAKYVGKTSRASAWYHVLRSHHVICAGFLERAVFDKTDKRCGYDYQSLHSGEIKPFARTEDRIAELNLNHSDYAKRFSPQGYIYAEDIWPWMEKQCANAESATCWFWDEFGILEADGGGIWPIFDKISAHAHKYAHICVCRLDTLSVIDRLMGGFDACIHIDLNL